MATGKCRLLKSQSFIVMLFTVMLCKMGSWSLAAAVFCVLYSDAVNLAVPRTPFWSQMRKPNIWLCATRPPYHLYPTLPRCTPALPTASNFQRREVSQAFLGTLSLLILFFIPFVGR